MNILVTGANGQLGRELRIVSTGSPHNFFFSDVIPAEGLDTIVLDITDIDAVRHLVQEKDIKCIINCAAYTNVDKAESEQSICERLNADAPRNLAEVMKEVKGVLVHISTDYVFGAENYNVPCKENQKGEPTGVYGRTKLAGEKAIITSGCDYVILRTSWLYSEFGKNFVKTMLNLTASKPEVKVVFDQVGTPTYAYDLAQAILKVVDNSCDKSKNGIYHFSNEGVCSWYDFAKIIAEMAGNDKCNIKPCHSDEFPSPTKRPSYSVLDKTKFKDTYNFEIPYWTVSLRKCLRNMNV